MADRVQIKGACRGYKSGAIFEIEGRGTWQQARYAYDYQYQYRPQALLEASGSRGKLKIDGHNDWIEVKKI